MIPADGIVCHDDDGRIHIEAIVFGQGIEHVEIIRIGSRTPVVMPMRITDELCEILAKYHPIYLNTHFNHPSEITEDSAAACNKLNNYGINIHNQSVLLKDINDFNIEGINSFINNLKL